MNGNSLLMLAILMMGIMPTLGFFTPGSAFVLLILLLFIVLFCLLGKRLQLPTLGAAFYSLPLLLYSAYYYGGYYQTPFAKAIGQIVFFSMVGIVIWNALAQKQPLSPIFFVFCYLTLASWTLFTSPHPHVDTVVVFKEAPLKLLHGVNPYDTLFSPVYNNIKPDYYNHLPLSFLFYVPFVLIPVDERIAVMLVTVLSFLFLYRLVPIAKRKHALIPLSLVLFMPGSFYMLEHMYHDSMIFFFFTFAVYSLRFSERIYYLLLSLFFNVKQNLLINVPFFISKKIFRNTNILYFVLPFFLIVIFFFWNPMAFLNDTVFGLQAGRITSPIQNSLTFPTLLIYLFPSTVQSQSIRIASLIIFGLLYVIFFFFHKGKPVLKTASVLYISYFFSHYAFFNSYYLVALLFLYDFLRDAYFPPRLKSVSP